MKKKLLHTSILGFAFILLILNSTAQNGIVKGKVHGGGGVLQGATVSAGNKSVLTDSTGEFLISLKPDTYLLIITHAGYKKDIREIKIEEGRLIREDFTLMPSEEMGEVVVLGSRSLNQRSNLNTPVPVDVFTSNNLVNTGRTSLTQMLNFASPSFNASREALNESFTLRGLNPDQVLILINGTRYHNMAFIQADGIRGHIGKGSASNDLNSIPFSAVEKIEILRDGASAQYGSDAIAGVINMQLKESTGKTSIQLNLGQYYKGDGENLRLGINHGFLLNKKGQPVDRKGFLNLSAELRFRNNTYRGGEYKGTVYYDTTGYSPSEQSLILALDNQTVKERGFDRSYVSNAGNSKLSSYGLLINGGYPLGGKSELFWTFAVNNRESEYLAIFIFPKASLQVNKELFPDGFRSRPIQYSLDVSGIAGIRGETKNNWHWEYSSAYGNNTCDYKPENTNNASQQFTLGGYAPTKFYTGSLIYQQLSNAINFVKELSTKNARIKLKTLGYGAEWRVENYKIIAGEEAAWENYDRRKQGGTQIALILRPENEINETRHVLATYIDLEAEYSKKLLLNIAGRYEYYDDFGDNLAGKIALRYKIFDQFSLRGSFGNGFRAPSMQQRYYNSTSNGYRPNTPAPFTSGTFRNDSEVAKAFGVPSLEPERSLNLSTGFTATLLNRISLTVDAYWIQIKNRIVHSGEFDRKNNNVDSILIANKLEVERLQFFTNSINTKTLGIDIVMNGNWNIKKNKLAVMLAANFTRTRLFGQIKVAKNLKPDSLNTNTLFGRQEVMKMERGQPDHKIILSLNYKTGKFEFVVRNTRFGSTSITAITVNNMSLSYNPVFDEYFSAKTITDVSISYSPQKWLTLTGGANNVFNVYPDRIKNYINTGLGQHIYSMEATPFGFNGGYYYVSLSFSL